MAELIFPIVGLPMGLLALSIGGMMLWDVLAAHGLVSDPERPAAGNGALAWLLQQARLGASSRPESKGLMWWRLLIAGFIGPLMIWFWFTTVFG